jgi:predicted RNA-binding protein with PUA-like domain
MPAYWIVKSEPATYSFGDLVRDGRTRWDGVRNAQALSHLREMKKGDRVLFYHTGGEKALVGLARVVSTPYADPGGTDPMQAVVDIEADRALARPVPLSEIKAEPALAGLGLVRQGRLSVVPASPDQWSHLIAMAR